MSLFSLRADKMGLSALEWRAKLGKIGVGSRPQRTDGSQ